MDLAAARYIRALFSATLPTRGAPADLCQEVEAFGRFAAGRLWHDLADDERRRFTRGSAHSPAMPWRACTPPFPT